MRTLKLFALAAGVILLAGCWTLSVDPLYFDEDVVYEPGLIGIWGDSTASEDETWTFLPADEETYRLVVTEEDDPDGVFEAHLVRLGGHLFMDLYPEEPEDGNEFYTGHVIPAHSFWRISLEGHVLVLWPLDNSWLRDKIKQGTVEITHLRRDDVIVLTAPTKELQEFMVRHFDEAFADDPLELSRLH